MSGTRRVVVYPDAATVATATAARLLTVLTDTLAIKDRADLILTGGTVGILTLREVAASPLAAAVDWNAVHLWWGDERFVAADDPDRNEGQAQEAMLAHLPIPEENIHRVGSLTEYESVEDAASAYYSLIVEHGDPEWDVAMFGMGPDGHVASLFPGHEVFAYQRSWGDGGFDANAPRALAVENSPKPPPLRVTLTLPTINHARQVWIVAAGEEKADAVARALGGDAELPAAAVHGTEHTLWLIDAAAASKA